MNDTSPRPVALLAASAALAVFTVYAAIRSYSVMDNFREVLEGFGAKIPPLTEFILNAPNFWWLIAAPAVGVFIWIAMKPRVAEVERSRMRTALIAIVVFGVALYGFVAQALYRPIFELGQSV